MPTDPTPDTLNPADNAAERLGGDLALEPIYQPETYPGLRAGEGRWVTIETHGEELGIVWTNDTDGLGWIATTDAGIMRTPDIVQAFQRARAAGTPATEVYDYWADLAGLGLSARPEQRGNLDTLG